MAKDVLARRESGTGQGSGVVKKCGVVGEYGGWWISRTGGCKAWMGEEWFWRVGNERRFGNERVGWLGWNGSESGRGLGEVG